MASARCSGCLQSSVQGFAPRLRSRACYAPFRPPITAFDGFILPYLPTSNLDSRHDGSSTFLIHLTFASSTSISRRQFVANENLCARSPQAIAHLGKHTAGCSMLPRSDSCEGARNLAAREDGHQGSLPARNEDPSRNRSRIGPRSRAGGTRRWLGLCCRQRRAISLRRFEDGPSHGWRKRPPR